MASGAGPASASAIHGPDFSSRAGIAALLQSRGFDPADAVWQSGALNYVGNACPGARWHCLAPTHRPVVQIAPAGGTNVYSCRATARDGAGSCYVVQVNGGAAPDARAPSRAAAPAGTNEYTCYEQASGGSAITLNAAGCSMNQSNTTGDNRAVIVQATTQRQSGTQSATETAGTTGSPITQTNSSGTNEITIEQLSLQFSSDSPTAAQVAAVSQTNGSGRNKAILAQQVGQRVNDSAATQDQEATQVACLTQDSPDGRNQAAVTQFMGQQERDTAAATQYQNQSPGPSSSCGSGEGEAFTTVNPNLAAFVLQDQNTPGATGRNTECARQALIQRQQSTASSGDVTQQQGTTYDEGGLEAIPDQTSSGLSRANTGQHELQLQHANASASPYQFQQDPIHQPPGEGEQGTNTSDTFTLTQSGVQHATPGDPADDQFYDMAGDCTTTGSCDVTQSETTNTGTSSHSCTLSTCALFENNEPD